MKKILILLLFAPFISYCQTKDTSFAQIDERFTKASKELTKFHSQYQGGIMLEIFGGVLLGLGSAANTDKGAGQAVTIGGAILTLAGFIMNLSSSVHIKNAGLYLKNGSLVVPIGNRKPVTIFKK